MPKTTKTETKSKKDTYIFAIGRRKESIAKVRLTPGKGEIIVNDMPVEKYFPGEDTKKIYLQPFTLTDSLKKFNLTIKCLGGGKEGQLVACLLGISRALIIVDKDKNRSVLKKSRLLTRDPRVRERRKVGTGGKARRQKQSPKR